MNRLSIFWLYQSEGGDWLEAVRQSGRVLYRGDDITKRKTLSTCAKRVGEEYDLLERFTYRDNDVLVADYFTALEGALNTDPRYSKYTRMTTNKCS